MGRLTGVVAVVAAFVFVPASLPGRGGGMGVGDACPTDICVCVAEEDIECSEMFLTHIPKFFPSAANITFETIDLSFNRIRRIGKDAFRNVQVRHIKMWNMKRINMTISSRAFRGLEEVLEEITIRKSNITKPLPGGLFANFSRLVLVDMPNNNLTVIKRGTFRDAGSVEKLYLEENNLRSLEDNVFSGLSGLKELKLAKNKISMVDSRAFQALTSLERLELRNNKIRDLQPKAFSQLTRLTSLDLAHNSIPALFPLMFTGLRSLDTLVLTHNPIIMIARQTFSSMINLRELHLQKSKLTYLKPGVFDGLVNLNAVFLHDNELRSLPDGLFFNLPALRTVQLEDNNLDTLNACAFEDITTIKHIQLLGNEIRCDCAMAWTSLQGKSGGARVTGRCDSPAVVRGQPVAQGDKYHVCRYSGLEACAHLRKPHLNDVMRFKYFKQM